MTRAVLGTDLQRGGPLVERASLLLTRGRRLGTKESYAGKWHRFVVFCTETLPDVYGWKPRCPLPANERTVILYLSHLSMEGLVKERSLSIRIFRRSTRPMKTFAYRDQLLVKACV